MKRKLLLILSLLFIVLCVGVIVKSRSIGSFLTVRDGWFSYYMLKPCDVIWLDNKMNQSAGFYPIQFHRDTLSTKQIFGLSELFSADILSDAWLWNLYIDIDMLFLTRLDNWPYKMRYELRPVSRPQYLLHFADFPNWSIFLVSNYVDDIDYIFESHLIYTPVLSSLNAVELESNKQLTVYKVELQENMPRYVFEESPGIYRVFSSFSPVNEHMLSEPIPPFTEEMLAELESIYE